MDLVSSILLYLLILVPSVILHEVAHGFVADKLGDPTARLKGRLTLNPLKHIDPFMTILLPLFFIISGSRFIFGAAKPVPVDTFNLRDGRKDMALVALSGPLTNILIAIVASLGVRIITQLITSSNVSIDPWVLFVRAILNIVMELNLFLAIFNLIPIPPLDGSKIVAMLLPEKEANAYLSIGYVGIFALFILLSMPIGDFSLQSVISDLTTLLRNLLLGV